MRESEVRDLLREHQASITREAKIQGALQLKLTGGEVINIHDTGKISLQGKRTDFAKLLQFRLSERGATVAVGTKDRPDARVPAPRVDGAEILVNSLEDTLEHEFEFLDGTARSAITINSPILVSLPPKALDAYCTFVQTYSDDLAREAERLEAGERDEWADGPEFTTRMIVDANIALRRRRAPSRSRRVDLIVDFSYAMAGAGVAVMGSFLHSAWQSGLFGAFVTAMAALVIYRVTTGNWRAS